MNEFNNESNRTLAYTFANSRYTCIAWVYTVHIFCAYMIALSGLACMLTRLSQRTKWLHKWFGRVYIMSMMWGIWTSTMIRNDGLPLFVIYAFNLTLGGLCLGWMAQYVHQYYLNQQSLKNLSSKKQTISPEKFEEEMGKERAAILGQRSVLQRFISYKGLHGFLMIISWFNVAGRLFVTNVAEEFACYMTPAFKALDSRKRKGAGLPMEIASTVNPVVTDRGFFEGQEWIWYVVGTLGPLAIALIVGLIYQVIIAAYQKKKFGTVTGWFKN